LGVVVVVLNGSHIGHAHLAAVGGEALDVLRDALGAVAVVPVRGERVRVRRTDPRVVSGDDEALARVVFVRQRGVGNVTGPVVLAGPAGYRPAAVAIAADRDAA